MVNRQWKLSTSGNLKTHIKQGVSPKEYYIHGQLYELSKVYNCLNVPRILSYNQDTETMTTVCVGTSNVSDFYGEESHKVPRRIFKAVRENSRYVWVEDSNNIIGRKPAHYEFISRRGKLYLELHFD